MEREVEPMATDTLLGAEREPKDRTSIPKVLSWSLWFFELGRFSGDLRAVSKVPRNLEGAGCPQKDSKGTEAGLTSRDTPRGAWRSIEGTLKSLRAQIQAQCQPMRSSELRGWLRAC